MNRPFGIMVFVITLLTLYVSSSVYGQNGDGTENPSSAKELPFESEEDDDTTTDDGDTVDDSRPIDPFSQVEPSTVSVSPSLSFREEITISSNTTINWIGLYTIHGKQIFLVERPEDNELSFSPGGLSEGMYLLRVKTISREHVKKIMVTK